MIPQRESRSCALLSLSQNMTGAPMDCLTAPVQLRRGRAKGGWLLLCDKPEGWGTVENCSTAEQGPAG